MSRDSPTGVGAFGSYYGGSAGERKAQDDYTAIMQRWEHSYSGYKATVQRRQREQQARKAAQDERDRRMGHDT